MLFPYLQIKVTNIFGNIPIRKMVKEIQEVEY